MNEQFYCYLDCRYNIAFIYLDDLILLIYDQSNGKQDDIRLCLGSILIA